MPTTSTASQGTRTSTPVRGWRTQATRLVAQTRRSGRGSAATYNVVRMAPIQQTTVTGRTWLPPAVANVAAASTTGTNTRLGTASRSGAARGWASAAWTIGSGASTFTNTATAMV